MSTFSEYSIFRSDIGKNFFPLCYNKSAANINDYHSAVTLLKWIH